VVFDAKICLQLPRQRALQDCLARPPRIQTLTATLPSPLCQVFHQSTSAEHHQGQRQLMLKSAEQGQQANR